jgi:RHS repeat-associated protein
MKSIKIILILALIFFILSSFIIKEPAHSASPPPVPPYLQIQISPRCIAINPLTDQAVVTDFLNKKVSVIDLNTQNILSTISLSKMPLGVAIDQELHLALVSHPLNNSISVISLDSFQVVKTIFVGILPVGISVDLMFHKALVSNFLGNSVSVIDLTTLTRVGTISVGLGPVDVAIDSELRLALVANALGNKISVIDLGASQVTHTVTVGLIPVSLSVNPETHLVGVANLLGNSLSVINLQSWETRSISVGPFPLDVAINSLDNRALVICDLEKKVFLVDLTAGTIVNEYTFDNKRFTGVAIDPYMNIGALVDNTTGELTLIQLPSPVPSITTITPDTILRGSPTTNVTIEGSGFIKSSIVNSFPVNFIDNHHLQIELSEGLLANAGIYEIVVTNPAPDGGSSNSADLKINNPVPALTALDPSETIAGTSGTILNILGTGFFSDTLASINGSVRGFTLIDHTKIQTPLLPEDVEVGGYLNVTAFNPPPGGGYSNVLQFKVVNPAPVLTSIAPNSIIAGSPDFTLTLNGDNFVKTSIFSFDGQAVVSTYISKTQLQATIPATTITTPGTYPVKVTNPTPGGGETIPVTFTVINLQPTVSISANPAVILYGTSSTLSWTSTNADSAFIDKGIGNVPTAGSITVSPVGTTTYTITVTGPGGTATGQVVVTVKADVEPPATPQSGYIDGRVLDVNTRTPIPGVLITLRDVTGAVFTDEDGRFSFPTPTNGRYLLTAERQGYAYGQRWVEVTSQRDMVVDSLYLMALDPQATTITAAGGTHLSADGNVEVVVPSGAVSAPIEVVTTDVVKSESLPAPLPPTSLFTYCVNLRPDDATFATQVRVRIKNYLNFPAGTPIPVGFYSKKEARWLNHGMSTVTADGQWVEFYTDHFSWYDCNSPGLTQRPPANITRNSQPRNQVCEESKDVGKSRIGMKSGNLGIEHKLPSYRSLGATKDLELVYNNTTAKPSALISFESEIDPSQSTVPPTITYNLRVEGNMTAARFIGERGKAYWGYLFDGINGRGEKLLTGVYPYRLDLSYDYSTTYARANFFGGPALDSTGVPTRETIPFTKSLDDFLVISNQVDSPFGAGWSLKELNRLYLQPDGNLVLVEGNGNAKAVFKRDDISSPLKVDENTILLYQFDGRENRAIDAAGRFNGTFYGEGHLVSEGKFGAGATFDGHGDYIRLGNVGAPPQGTVEAWVYFPKGSGINTSYLMIAGGGREYGNSFDTAFDLGVHYGWGGDLRFGIWQYPGGGWQWAASGITPAQLAGGWHHIAGTWGSKGVEVWIDGERKGYNSYTGGFQNPNYETVLVGSNSWTWAFNGIIDDFRISNIQRSPGMASYSPLNDYSLIVRNADGTYTRTLKDGIKINFNAEGLHTSSVDRNGNTTSYSYNQSGLLTSITDPTGLVTIFGYDGNGRLSSITDPAGRTTQVSIDAQGNLVSVTNADGTAVSYAYDADHLLVAKTDSRGFTTQYIYDGHHRISEVHAPDGGTTRYRPYDVQGLINDLPQGTGTFDNPAPLIKPTDIQVSKTDPVGQTTNYQVNSFGTFNEISDPLGRVTKQEFDKSGNLTKIIRPDGSQILMTYDGKGNVLTRTDPLNHITSFSYEPQFNQITSITDALSRVTNFGYDAKGNLTTITNSLGKVTSIGYDTKGVMTSITDPLGQITTFNYDATGNLSSVKDPLENITAFGYDSAGNMTSMTDAEGKTTQYQYDQHNRLLQITDSLGGTITYVYQNGCPDCARSDLLTSLSDANGNTTSFSYDTMGRLIGIADPLSFQKLFSYDLNGNLISQTDPNGNTITYTYDWANRLTGKTMPGDVVTYGYDAVDNLTSAVDNDSAISMGYDPAGRLTSVTTGGSVLPVATIGYTYDPNGNRTSMIDMENGVTSYQYDFLNRLSSLTDPQAEAVSFTYDFLNRRTGVTFPNGVQTVYLYDAANRLTSLVHQISGVNIESFSYAHDKLGNRTSMTDLSGTHAYGYDNLYRLISATHPQPANPAELYTFDPVGNRLSSAQHPSWSYDTNNRLLSFNGTSFAYDNNGNMISRTDQTSTTTYQYDAENRLIRINKPDGTVIAYRYDPFGRRIEKSVNGTITRYLYDGESILYEMDGSNTMLARYTHGPGIDEPLITNRGGSSYYYHADGLGSITHITDATGSIVQSYVYSAFGEIVAQAGGLANPYTYTSREYDPESGLYYYRARYYDTKIGRFLQTDPIGFGGGDVNLYVYVQNNPINEIDPLGLFIMSVKYSNKPYGSITMVWNSWLPEFYRSGTRGDNGTEIRSGIYRYKYGTHPISGGYPALNLYTLGGSRTLPATRTDCKGDTASGINFHRGNPLCSDTTGSLGCHVIPREGYDDFIGQFSKGDKGLYFYIRLW